MRAGKMFPFGARKLFINSRNEFTTAPSCVILALVVVALQLAGGALCLQVTIQQQQAQNPQQQQQQIVQALDKQRQQQMQQHVVAIQQAQQQQQQQATTPAASHKSAKSNHRLVNKIKDARHRRRHRHQRRRQHQNQLNAATNQQQQQLVQERKPPPGHVQPSPSQASAFAAMAAAAAAAAEPAVQAASSTALIALESIVEEVARAGAQLPLAAVGALQHQQQQQQHAQQPQNPASRQQQPEAQQQSSPALSGSDVLLDGASSPSSSVTQQTPGSSAIPQAMPPTQQQQQQQQQTSVMAPQPTANVHQTPMPTHVTRGPLHNTRGFLLTTTLSKIYNLLNVTEFALEMRDGISSRASCVACNAVVGLFLSPLYSKDVFSAAIRTVCISFRIQSARVCQGLVESFQDDFEYIRKNTKLTRDEVCGVVFGVDCARRQTYNLFWTVPIPEMPPNHPLHPNNAHMLASVSHKPLVESSGLQSSASPSTLPIPLDEHSLTSMDDAPDLLEYRKSNIAMSAAASSALPATSNSDSLQVGSQQHLSQQPNQQEKQKQADDSEPTATPSGGSMQRNEQLQLQQQQQHQQSSSGKSVSQKKGAKMLTRPQYIIDDERHHLIDNSESGTNNNNNNNDNLHGAASNGRQQVSSFVHITDIHIDPYYEAGSLNECNEPLCCRATSGTVAPNDKRRRAGRWGDYGNCDVPVRTLRNALERIREKHSDAEYWLWTGDISPHDIWNISKAEAANHVRLVTKMVRDYSNGLPVFPVIGNHEAHPVNSFSPPEIKGKFSMSWLYDLLADEWSDWLPEDALKTLRIGGYYKLQVRRGFRIIAMNTNYCARLNPWSFYDPVDPANQLKWLVDELLEAELNQDKVHIIGHVPPDNRECTQAWLFNFINIVDRFRDTIVAQFFGHTHRDEWRVIYSLTRPDEPIGIQFIGPSITPFTENNPAYRIYHQDRRGYVLDSETYYFNLTEANETPTSEPQWRFSYSTREHLNMTQGLGPGVWHQYLQKLHDDDEAFDIFHKNFYRFSDVKLGQTCKNKCKYQLLSDLRLSHPYKTKPKPFLANRKTSNHHRDRHDHHHHHHHHHRRLRSHQE